MKLNWKIEVIKKNKEWKEFKSESHWKRLKYLASTHAYEVYLWDLDKNEILDGVY